MFTVEPTGTYDDSRNAWIRAKTKALFPFLTEDEINDLMLFSSFIPTFSDAETKLQAAKAKFLRLQELQVRLVAETEATKRKAMELEGMKLCEDTKRQKIRYDQSNSSNRFDLTFNYYETGGGGSFITPFDTIFGSVVPGGYSGIVYEMPWVTASYTRENDYQRDFNTFLQKFGESKTDKGHLVVYNPVSSLHIRDTHSSQDHLIGLKKPDTTIYLSNPNGVDPGPSPLKLCFFIEFQLNIFDAVHATAIIHRSELAMNRAPHRSHLFTLWLSLDNLAVHKVEKGSEGFIHSFSTTVSMREPVGAKILHFFLNAAEPGFFGVPVFSQKIESFLQTNNLFASDFLGSGTYSYVYKITHNSDLARNHALKVYRHRDGKHMFLKNQEVKILRKLSEFACDPEHPETKGIPGVPSILHHEDEWILLNKVIDPPSLPSRDSSHFILIFQVCEPLKWGQITPSLVGKLRKTLDQVHAAGVFWGDCRPDNLGVVEDEPLLIDWNLAVERGEHTHPHNGTRCFVSQRLLRSTEQSIERICDDDKESLLKSLLGIMHPGVCNEISAIHEAAERATRWEQLFSGLFGKPIDEAIDVLLLFLPDHSFV